MIIQNIEPVTFENVHITKGFWKPRIDTVRNTTAQVCIDECERTHRIDNFRIAGGLKDGKFEGIYYNDSDVYKVLEGIAYTLLNSPSPELEQKADEIIDAICAAQQPDGYLYTYFTLNTPDKRWTDMSYHEAYCLGHMVEGAIAYAQATGKTRWLDAAERAVQQMMSVIGEGKKHWVTGHEEIELALVKLWRYTGNEAYLNYSKWLIHERGHGHLAFPIAYEYLKDFFHPAYCQDDKPINQLKKVTGHAVRAMYYYSGVADIASVTKDEDLYKVLDGLWHNVVPANMYLTGGIGQSAFNEGFTKDWSLPNLTAYCETCAAVGMALWNRRMNELSGESRFADIVETELYNGILAGISLSGDRFFYENPLASVGKHHRQAWFGTSCCPTNLIRFIPSIGGYVYGVKDDAIYLNQFIDSDSVVKTVSGDVHISITTDYPWNGLVKIDLSGFNGTRELKIRKPGWCEKAALLKNGEAQSITEEGYFVLQVNDGDSIVYDMDMPIRRVYADERIEEDKGRVAVMRGPLVYCAEGIDNDEIVTEYFHADKALSSDIELNGQFEADLLGGVYTINGKGIRLIPYYTWDNRESGAMTVWMKEI